MKVRVERTIDKPSVKLILNDVKLFLVSFRCNLAKILRHFCFTKGNHSFVFEITAKWYLYESLIGSNTKNRVVIIELPFECLIRTLVIK